MTEIPHPADVYIGARVAARRRDLGQSQTQLGVTCGVTFQQIQKYEKGANRISCSMLTMIAKAQGMAPAWYFEGLELEEAEAGLESTTVRTAADWLHTRDALDLAVVVTSLDPATADFLVWLSITAGKRLAAQGVAVAPLEDEGGAS